MKKALLLLTLCLCAFVCRAQNTQITASHISVFGGSPITGSFCLSPTDADGNAINITTTTGQQFTPQTPLCFPIVAGVLSSSAIVPDTSLTTPSNVCYALTVKNNFGQVLGTYPCIQPFGSTWSFDSYIPGTVPAIPSSALPTFKTNGVTNPAQTVLNITGSGVSYGAGGQVNISGSGGSGGGTALYPAQCATGGAPTWCSGTTADAWIRAACTALPSAGGAVNLAGLTGTIAATTRGCSTPSKQIIFIEDPTSTLTVTETDGDVAFPLDNNSIFLGPGNGACVSNAGIRLASSANVAAIVGTAHTDGSQEQFGAIGLCLWGNPTATVGEGIIYSQGNFATTTIEYNQVFECNTACARVINSSGVSIQNNWFNVTAGSATVGVPLLIQSVVGTTGTGCKSGSINISGGQIEHAYGGGPEITAEGDGAGALVCGIRIQALGVERNNASGSTIGIKLQDCQNCSVDHVNPSGTSGGTDFINISETAASRTLNVAITSESASGAWTNIINDTTPNPPVPQPMTATAYPQVTSYVAQAGYSSSAGGTIAAVHQTGQTAAISTATLCSSTLCPAGQYLINVSMMETGTACSSPGPGSVIPSISWTDSNGTAQTSTIPAFLPGLKFSTALAGTSTSGTLAVSSNGSVIQYSTAYTGCTTGTGTYQMDLAVSTPGSGSVVTGGTGTPGGSPMQVQYNNTTTFGGDPSLTFNPSTKALGTQNLNGIIYAAGVNGAGIGVAQAAWSSLGAYAQCTAVSYSSANYLAVAANTDVTPGTNSAVWYPVPNANTPTNGDCAFYIAASLVNGPVGAQLILPPGNTNTSIGFMEPTVTSPGYPNVAIRGAGKHASTLTQTTAISAATITQPQSGTAYAFANVDWEGFTVNANFLAPAAMNVYGAQQFRIEHVALENPADGSDHYIEFGETSGANHTYAWTYEPTLTDIDTLNSHGPGTGALLSVSVSGGVPTITVTNGGAGYSAAYTQINLSGTGATADAPCTTRGTDTITVSSGVITGVTTTASGCASTVYASVFGGNRVTYGLKFNDTSDSKLISGLTPSEANTGVWTSNITSQMKFVSTHPISTNTGVLDQGNNIWESTQIDSVYRYGFDLQGATNVERISGSDFEYNAGNIPGVIDYHFGKVTGSPSTAPYLITISGDLCGSAAPTAGGYYHFATPGGGKVLPDFAHPTDSPSCDAIGSPVVFSYNGNRFQTNVLHIGASGSPGSYIQFWDQTNANQYTDIAMNGGNFAFTNSFGDYVFNAPSSSNSFNLQENGSPYNASQFWYRGASTDSTGLWAKSPFAINFELGDQAGAQSVNVKNSVGTTVASINSSGALTVASCTGCGSSVGQPIQPKQIGSTGVYYYADQFSGADVSARINACNAAVLTAGGGTCDDRTLAFDTGVLQNISVPVVIGDNSGTTTTAVHHIFPPSAYWTVTITSGGSACAINQWSGSSIDGAGGGGVGGANTMVILTQASTNVHALYCTNTSAGWNDYIQAGDFALRNTFSGATLAELADIEDIVDQSRFHNIYGSNLYGNGLYVNNICCSAAFDQISFNSAVTSNGGIPAIIGNASGGVVQAVTFKDSVFNSPGIGKNDIQINNAWGTVFINTYMEGNGASDTTTAMVNIGSTVNGITMLGGSINSLCTSACASKYGFLVNSSGPVHIEGFSGDYASYLHDVPNSRTYGNIGVNLVNPAFYGGTYSSSTNAPAFNNIAVGGSVYLWDPFSSAYSNIQANYENIYLNPQAGGTVQTGSLNGIPLAAHGSTFTVTGCGTATSLIGTGLAGTFHAAATACAPVITTGLTAPDGYVCSMNDRTTPADFTSHFNTSDSTTTATWPSQTVVSGDVMAFSCTPY